MMSLVWLLGTLLAYAHSPYALSIRLYPTERGALVEIVAQTAGVEAAFAQHFPDAPVPLASQAGKERLVSYLKETLVLEAPGGPLVLGAGAIKVDAAQVLVRLSATVPGEALLPLTVRAPCLTENHGQRNTFHLVRGQEDTRVPLTEASGFSARLVEESGTVVSHPLP